MILYCINCGNEFVNYRVVGYCSKCLADYDAMRAGVHQRQRPEPGAFADGKFAEPIQCLQTIPIREAAIGGNVCGRCGSDDLNQGYGLGSGYGIGTYIFCGECHEFLDFSPDF